MRNLKNWIKRDVRVIDENDEHYGEIGYTTDIDISGSVIFVLFDDLDHSLPYMFDQLELA